MLDEHRLISAATDGNHPHEDCRMIAPKLELLLQACRTGELAQVRTSVWAAGGRNMALATRVAVDHGQHTCVAFLLQEGCLPANCQAFLHDQDVHNEALQIAALKGDAQCVRLMLSIADATSDNSAAVQWAALKGHVACVELLGVYSSVGGNTAALQLAAKGGHVACVQYLLNIDGLDCRPALQMAARHGHIECVELLMAKTGHNPSLCGQALHEAAGNGQLACLRALLVADIPSLYCTHALEMAARNNHTQAVDMLWDVSDPAQALFKLERNFPDHPPFVRAFKARIDAQQQRQVLAGSVEETMAGHTYGGPRKM